MKDGFKSSIRILALATALLYTVTIVAFALALYIRGQDLEGLDHDTNVEAVRSCFRNSNQRGNLLDVALDSKVPQAVRALALTSYANTPTVRECRQLARDLRIDPIQESIR